jgi:pterin-4a-carbinolamine dehydratase/catechol 2,3-dioxygenase-like lactoylglutathione lyase family enzyme
VAESLARRACQPCHGGTPPLTADRAAALLSELDGWRVDGGKLARAFPARDMVAAADLAARIAALAEAEGHHPELRVTWRGLDARIWTHAIGALSENDFILAAKIDRLAAVAPRPIAALGEIALRVVDLDGMHAFYERAVGLEPLRRFEDISFFRIAAGYGGHTQVLALFRRDGSAPRADATTLDHLAFAIPLDAYEAERERLEALGLALRTASHAWVQWRSLYVDDPEGNLVELVCYDPSVEPG